MAWLETPCREPCLPTPCNSGLASPVYMPKRHYLSERSQGRVAWAAARGEGTRCRTFFTTKPPIEWTTKMMGTSPSSRGLTLWSFPNFICRSKSFANSEMLKRSESGDVKLALYPNVRIRTCSMPGSSGSHCSGQNRDRSFFHDHVRRLVPPRPCTRTISATRSPGGS